MFTVRCKQSYIYTTLEAWLFIYRPFYSIINSIWRTTLCLLIRLLLLRVRLSPPPSHKSRCRFDKFLCPTLVPAYCESLPAERWLIWDLDYISEGSSRELYLDISYIVRIKGRTTVRGLNWK